MPLYINMIPLNKIRLLSVLLGFSTLILFSSCFLVDSVPMPIYQPQEFDYSSNVGINLACQIGMSRANYKNGKHISVWQYMKGDSSMSIKRKNIVIKHKGTYTPIEALRIQETSKFKKWWKKYWMRENIDWRKVRKHDFNEYDAFMKIDFYRDIETGDTLEIIERDFPQQGDSVIIVIRIPHEFPREIKLRSYNYDADLQLSRLKKQRENRVGSGEHF